MFGAIEANDDIPEFIDRIALTRLETIRSTPKKHAAKFARWLNADKARHLVVICYDDREIMLDGKKVVGPDGGTYRATHRMIDALGPDFPLTPSEQAPFTTYTGLDERIRIFIHPNPDNKILHTALVGDMNGLVQALTLARRPSWGGELFGGPRATSNWIQPEPTPKPTASAPAVPQPASGAGGAAPRPAFRPDTRPGFAGGDAEFAAGLPPQPANAVGGSKFCDEIASLSFADREAAIFAKSPAAIFPNSSGS